MTRVAATSDDRRSREIGRTQEDILHAAAKVYASHGFEGTTIRRIAEEAGYTPAALYSYFEGKEQIFRGLVQRMQQSLLDTFAERQPTGVDFAHRLELLLLRQMESVQNQWQACVVFFLLRSPGTDADSGSLADKHAGFPAFHQAMSQWLLDAGAKEAIAVPADEAADILVGLTYAMFRRWLRNRGPEPLSDVAPRIVNLFLHGAAGAGRQVPS